MNSSVQYNDENEAFDNKKQHPWRLFHTIQESIYTNKVHKVPNFPLKDCRRPATKQKIPYVDLY